MRRKISIVLIGLSYVIGGCQRLGDPDPGYAYAVPGSRGDELTVSSLSAEGIQEGPIVEATDLIMRESYKRIDGMLILRNNRLVYENYFHGYSEDVPHNMYSAFKSITAILAGIAIDKGLIQDVDTRVLPLLPEYSGYQNPDPRKDLITIEDLLNMTSGLDCDDLNKNTESIMQQSPDWVKFTLDLPMVTDPGSRGVYCTGCPVILGRVIEHQSKMSLQAFAREYLFEPLGITDYQWHIMPDGKASAGGLFFLRPRDMAKIGLLMLNDGVWHDRQIVSSNWVQRCTENKLKLESPFDGYGYLWWKQRFRNGIACYFASGNGGQYIYVIPDKQLVVVFTSGNKNTGVGLQNFQIVNDYILPAIQ